MEKQFVCTLCNERFEERAPIEHGLAEPTPATVPSGPTER